MYGYNNGRNSGITRIYDYAQAVKWFNDTPPIRGKGRNAGIKPLGHRNRLHFQIHKADDDSILCRLYDTDVVVFKPNGDIVVNPLNYVTMTTANFIGDVLGIRAFIHDRSLQISIHADRYRINNSITLRRDEQGLLHVTEADKCYVLNINRKAKKDVLAKFKPFEEYVRTQMKIRDRGTFEVEEKLALFEDLNADANSSAWSLDMRLWNREVSEAVLKHKKLVELASSDDIGNWYLAIRWLAFSQVAWSSTIHTSAESIIDALHTSVMAITPEVFKVIEVPAGMVKKNAYRKFEPFILEASKWQINTPT